MRQLTIKQTETLVALAELTFSGKPPTIRELADHLGINCEAAFKRLCAIERKGYIRSEPEHARARTITQLGLSHPAIAQLLPEPGPMPALPQYIVTGHLGHQMQLVWFRAAA